MTDRNSFFLLKQIRDDSRPTEVKTTRVVQSRTEVKTVEDKVDGKPVAASPQQGIGNSLYTLWQTADTAVLILFVCVSIIVLSYVVENYCRYVHTYIMLSLTR